MNSSLDAVFDASLPPSQDAAAGASSSRARAHSRPRRRDGHPDPGPGLRRERISAATAFSACDVPSAGQQRPSDADPAAGDRGHPFRLCDGRRGHSRDQHLLLDLDRAGRLRHAGGRSTSSTATARGWRAGPRSRRRKPTAGAASSPARSARPTAPPRCRPTSTIPASAR